MTEKRFMYFEHKGADYILDNPNTELDFIEMLGDCLEAEEIVDRLNEQDELIKELEMEKKSFMDDAIKFEKECKRLYNNLRLTNSDLCYEKLMHNKCKKENKQLKQELESFEQINFTDMCDGTRTVWYMKKENVGDD